LQVLGSQFGKADAAEMGADVAIDRGFITGEGSWTNTCPRHILQPTRQELGDGPTLVGDETSVLGGPERYLEGIRDRPLPNRAVVRSYNKRGTAEQWIKERKQAAHWTRLSCHRFRANEVRLQLSVLAYNLGNLWRRLVLPARIEAWSLTSLQQRIVKTGGRLVKHARYYRLMFAESYLTRRLFGAMLQRIWALPVPAG
jgi:hypothetical protein